MRYIIKKIFTLALCICLMFSLTACGQENESEISELSVETSQEEKKQDDKESEEAVKNLEKMKDTSDKVKNIALTAICIGIMICIITAYFPEIRIPDTKEK